MFPREKMQKFGIDALDDKDLIAIILGHGTKKEDVFKISDRLIKKYGPNPLVSINKTDELSDFFNIGYLQSAKLISAVELGRRLFDNKNKKNIKLSSPKDVFDYMKGLSDYKKEYIYGIYLNTRNLIMHEEVLSLGSLESTSVNIRDIFYPVLANNAYSFIIIHNHPSEDPSPSEDDIKFTKEIEKAASILHISFLDHIILAKNSYYSFKGGNLV